METGSAMIRAMEYCNKNKIDIANYSYAWQQFGFNDFNIFSISISAKLRAVKPVFVRFCARQTTQQ